MGYIGVCRRAGKLDVKIMLIAVFAFGILSQAEAFQISSNISDATDGPSPLNIPGIETEETTSYIFHFPREDEDPMLDKTSTLHPDIPNSSDDVSSVLLTETNATTLPNTTNSLFYETDTSLLRQSYATVFSNDDFPVFPERSTTGFPEITTTLFPEVTIPLTPEVSKENPLSKCPNIGGPQVAGSVVKCYCKGNEIYLNGTCHVHDGAIVIPVPHYWIYTKEANVTGYNVTVQDVNCDTSKHSYMTFTKNQFRLRPRGDVVLLKEAGELEGQRINNYCIFHHLDEYDDLTLTMKACVPIPSVPRCCPPGKAMKEGKCEVANTPDVLKPPISAKPFSDGIDWGSITEYHSPVKCDSEYEHLKTIPLGHKQSHLVSLADGVANVWIPGDIGNRYSYYNCPDYCVDGINNSEGSVDYFTSFCYSDPKETHEKACAKGPCLRKCCKYGYSMDKNRYSCVPDPNSTFTPSTDADLSNYNIVIGWPLCTPVSKVEETFSVDRMGNLILKDKEFTSSDFCVDTFLDNEERRESALACLTKIPLWFKARPYLFPICYVISLIFLMITIVIFLLDPKLLTNGGLHQLCLVIALSIAHITGFYVYMSQNSFIADVCFDVATAMQFGFLATFFWLNVMCFEIWRKIRRLRYVLPCKSYPNKYYMMYGWGIPFCICVITVFIQKYSHVEIWEFYEVYSAEIRWFLRDNNALYIHFYGPIAVLLLFNSVFLVLTYINYKRMPQNYKETTKDTKVLRNGVISEQRNVPPGQITNHIHDFNQNLKIFMLLPVLFFVSLVIEVLSWKILSSELRAFSDTLNSLQGFFLSIILLSNSNKRKHLEKKFPKLYKQIIKSNRHLANMKRWIQNIVNRAIS